MESYTIEIPVYISKTNTPEDVAIIWSDFMESVTLVFMPSELAQITYSLNLL